MSIHRSLGVAVLAIALCNASWAQDQPTAESEANAAEVAAIRETETTFRKAFDEGNADAVAAHWTEDGEFVNDGGERVTGREAIAKAYKTFFEANPGAHITNHIDGIRIVNAETAIEDGTVIVEPPPAGAPGSGRYTAVHVKKDGKWLMVSVHESRIESPSNFAHLEDLDWLVGTWVVEKQGVELTVTCQWIANKNFLEQRFRSVRGGVEVASATQVVGWDPATATVKSWTFSSDGGHAVGVWTPHETGWIIHVAGTMIDGTPTSAVNIFTALDDNGIAWRSVNRTAGAFRMLDSSEVILKRKTPTK